MRITYDGNGYTDGTVPTDSTNYSAGEYATVKAPGTMIKDGSTFAGWRNISNTKTYYPRNKIMMYRSTTMQARWEPACAINYDTLNAINIEGIPPFDGRRYNIGDEVIVPPHDALTALQAVVGDGDGRHIEGLVSLQGWRIITGAEADHEVLKAGDSFTVTGGMVVLQALWAASEISIAYEINGANGDTPEVQTALSGRRATLAVPSCIKPGYYFNGWRDMATDEVYAAGTEASFMGCTTLEAVWVPLDEYTVHYDVNGASGGEPPADEQVFHGDNVYLPEISEQGGIYKTGYTFAGWVRREPEFLIFDPLDAVPVTQNTTFYARWMPDDESLRRHVTYTSAETDVDLGGELPIDYMDYVDGDYAFAKTWSPLKMGRHAVGWKQGGTVYQFGDRVPILGNITLEAVWGAIPPVTLKFTGGEGATGTVADIICDSTGSVMLPDANNFSRNDHIADGWIAPDGTKLASGTLVNVNIYGEAKELEYAVNWVNTVEEHTVTYFSIGHDSGHVPLDPCKYHIGESIPLAPAGDLRKDGFELIGWDDVTTGQTYVIPSNEDIIAYCTNPDRPDYDSVIPQMWCTGDHMLRAHWVPVAQLFFGSLGTTSGLPPEPIRVRYENSISIPDQGTLSLNGYTFAGWKDAKTGIIYKAGDLYQCAASETLVLQPLFATVSIVEYIIPPELGIANAAWVPKGGYCVNCHSKMVIVPPEMKGQYCWVRSDTGERITETGEIHDIYGDICLTLTPISMSNEGDDRWVWSTHVTAEGLTPMHGGTQRCGDLFEFPRNFGAGFAGWILNNDERRIYQPGEKVRIYGHAQLRAVYPNATHAVTFSYPEGTLAEAPEDTEALAEGALYQLPSGEGIRGPKGTKLLYWCGIDQTETEDDPDIIRKWYPGEYLRVPVSTETVDGKMLDSDGNLVVYPLFGDKFTAVFADSEGKIMPRAGFEAEGVYAEYQAIRTPQVTNLARSAHTDDEWKAAWRIPWTDTQRSAYTGMFGASEEASKQNAFILDLIPFVICGWVFYRLAKACDINLEDKVACWLEKEFGLPLTTHLEYVYDETVEVLKTPPDKSGMWWNSTHLPDPNEYYKKPNYIAIGWRFVGSEGMITMPPFRSQYHIHAEKNLTAPIIFGARGNCKWEIIWSPYIMVYFNLTGAMDAMNSVVPGTRERYNKAINPRWISGILQTGKRYARGIFRLVGDPFARPIDGMDFEYTNPYKDIPECGSIEICDRWYPREVKDDELHYNNHLFNAALPDSEFDLYLEAHEREDDPRNTVVNKVKVPDPVNSPYSKYFKTLTIKKLSGEEVSYYVLTFDLRWARPEWVEYTYFREHRSGEQNKRANIRVTGRPKTYRAAFAPGEYPRVADEKGLPEFREWIVGDDDTTIYYFKHWKIRVNSDMYRYYAEHNIPDRDKEYYTNDSLPYVRVDQPTVHLYLDAVYSEQEPPEPKEAQELGYGDEDTAVFTKFASWVGSLFSSKSKSKGSADLKSINAFSCYQQNASNAQHKAQSSGILDTIIAGADALSAVASAIGSIFGAATYLRNEAPELRLDDQNKVEATKLVVDHTGEMEFAGEVNKVVKEDTAKMRQFYHHMWDEDEKFVPKGPMGYDEIVKLTHVPEFKTLPGKITQQEITRIENISAQQEKVENFKHKIEQQDYDSGTETDVDENYIKEVNIMPNESGYNAKLSPDIIYERGYTNVPKIEIEQKSMWNVFRDQMLVYDGIPDLRLARTLVGTPSPHQLAENTAEYVYIKYVPRDPDDPNWYTAGDTVPIEEGKVPLLMHYLKFANRYDDNAPDSETHTVDETYYEPHNMVIVKACRAEAPSGMEFAGWILDENTTTRSIVQPDDTLTQGICNHTFKALWLPANPTRFPGLRNPAPIVPNPSEAAKLNPVPTFGEEALQ